MNNKPNNINKFLNVLRSPLKILGLVSIVLLLAGIVTAWTYTNPPRVDCFDNGTCVNGNTKWNETTFIAESFYATSNVTAGYYNTTDGRELQNGGCDASYCIRYNLTNSSLIEAVNGSNGKADYRGSFKSVWQSVIASSVCTATQRCTIQLGAGEYIANTSGGSGSTLGVPTRSVVKGLGRNATTVKLADNSNNNLFVLSGYKDHVTISDMTIDGNKGNNANGELIMFNNTAGSGNNIYYGGWGHKLSNLLIVNSPGVAINISANTNMRIFETTMEDIEIYAPRGYGIYESFSSDEVVRNVQIYSGETDGYYCSNNGGAMFYHLHAYNNSGNGTYLGSGCNANNFVASYMDTNGKDGLVGIASNKNKIIGGYYMDNGWSGTNYSGINLTNSEGNFITMATFDSAVNTAPAFTGAQWFGIREVGTTDKSSIFGNWFGSSLNASGKKMNITGANTAFGFNQQDEYGFRIPATQPTVAMNGSMFFNGSYLCVYSDASTKKCAALTTTT